jgi:tetratricopeptide (TPR) repeat protein
MVLPAFGADNVMQLTINQSLKKLSEIRDYALYVTVITIFIGSIGAVIGIIQTFNRSFVKVASVVLGGIVAIATVVKDTAFDADHKELRRRAQVMEIIVEEMKQFEQLARDSNNPANRETLYRQVRRLQAQLHRVSIGAMQAEAPAAGESTRDQEVHNGRLWDFIPAAFAGGPGEEPDWLRALPEDTRGQYFVGIGDGVLVSSAQRSSYLHAFEQVLARAASRLTNPDAPISSAQLGQYLAEVLTTRASYVQFDEKTKMYRFFTLVRVDRILEDSFLRQYVQQKSVTNRLEPVKFESTRSGNTLRWRAYRAALDDAKRELSSKAYNDFTKSMLARQTGECARVLSELFTLAKRSRESYLVWYTYAECLWILGGGSSSMPSIREAFARATQLADKRQLLDASLYTKFGTYLYRARDYRDAVTHLKRSLDIDADQPRVRAMLKAAETKARSR